ncbi:hypothetical protein ACFL43_03360 [Thermodesulfobacteriota bacterium]
MNPKSKYDYYLILATTVVLFLISAICIYSMFYFKLEQIQQLPLVVKARYMNTMNTVMAPFMIALIVLLGICVPKRLLPTAWLNRFSAVLVLLAGVVSAVWDVKAGLAFVLVVSAVLQVVVLCMAVAGSKSLNFEKTGYWVRVGSTLLHLGLILFVLDIFFYHYPRLHLTFFWGTTISTTAGMVFCFYADSCSSLVKKVGSTFL